jgi:hypothetical protein
MPDSLQLAEGWVVGKLVCRKPYTDRCERLIAEMPLVRNEVG